MCVLILIVYFCDGKVILRIMSILTSLYLALWKSHKFVGPNKEIRLTRTYEECGKGVLDVIWCLRDYRKIEKGKKIGSHVITERTSPRNARQLIRQIEREELPKAIEKFLKKMEG